MKKLDLFIHVAHCAEPKLITVDEAASVGDLIEQLHVVGLFPREGDDEVLVFQDNRDEPLDRRHQLRDCGVGHRHLIHSHRCHHVKVIVHYHDTAADRSFPPSARVSRVLKWAASAFKLTGVDAQGLELRLKGEGNEVLPADSHIGCYTRPGHCAVELCLVPKVRVEG